MRLAVRQAAGDQLENLTLACREVVELGLVREVGRWLLGHAVDHPPGDGG